ncbi:hypothetical protein QQS21_007500 [Conoideocrella luteorostrata]|uniref:Uncharacterized protein n=1 Tax=Conoideocrella luteorostrata TaxID=1105319 RepID=A0AAJ0CLG6_9HYPO|nr:hypothetical protein QQS21_007500 [Conoideocrella luteorostrata]
MADHDAPRPPARVDPRAGFLTPESRSRASHETGESSRSGRSWRQGGYGAVEAGAGAGAGEGVQGHQRLGSSPAQRDDSGRDSLPRTGSARRKGKPKSGGGFWLHDSISGNRQPTARSAARDTFQSKGKATWSPQTPESSRLNNRKSTPQHADYSSRTSHDEMSASPHSAIGQRDTYVERVGGNKGSDETSPQALSRSSDEAAGDIDSTQIVQMALNLSGSRRIASRRHVSRGTPPRLGPLPDSSSGSNLRQHLQQQRKSSYSNSPRLQQASSPRLSSGRIDGPLHASFEGARDAHYRYQFSSPTLARAQKAKDHLELMAQYRRLLDVLPPLKPDGYGRNLAASPPGSPIGNKPFKLGQGDSLPLGRQYNPLQYIRNRKVRARERKVIDGEKQGFGDIECVKPWVDRVVERATSFAANPDEDNSTLPRFPGADDVDDQASPNNLSRAATRVRRPRVDWFVEPCDIVADSYWLDHKNHKELIEDRHWRRIFPPAATMSRPMSRETEFGLDAIPPFSMQDGGPMDPPILGVSKVDTGLSHNSAKDRAKQTLHNLRAFPHRHNGQNMHSEFMRHKKDSTSDISGSENDARKDSKRPAHQGEGNGTITNTSKDQVEEQMLDMVAADAHDRDHLSDAFSEPEAIGSAGSLRTPDRNPISQPPSRFHSRKGSLADTSDSDRKPTDKSFLGSPARYLTGRQSLDVPDQSRKSSVRRDHSLPTSPELRPVRGNSEPVVSANLSPSWSRSGSPHRNPISKIKQIIRDKSGDMGVEQDDHQAGPVLELSSPEKPNLPERRQSSPLRAPLAEQVPSEPTKTHRRAGSTRLRQDDQAGLRGIFKGGPRIDTVIRGSVSKIGDMLWKREGANETGLEIESTDESESERARGRSRSSTNVSRRASRRRADAQNQPKHFLDVMPHFNHVNDAYYPSSTDNSKVDLASGAMNHGQQPSRFDLLRPPRIDPRGASSSALPETRQPRLGDSDASESDSRHGGSKISGGVRDVDNRSSSMLELTRPEDDARSFKSRHWSIADKGTPNQETRLTRREIARMRALVLSTGIKAMEINRRAQEAHDPFRFDSFTVSGPSPGMNCVNLGWGDIAKLCPEAAQLSGRDVASYELYVAAGRSLSAAIQSSGQRWQASADQLTYRTSPQLQNRIGDVRSRIADDLSEQSRQASDLADETNRDLALGQPLKVKVVVDIIEKMLRRRRRRLRWVRRALWLTVEWLLVGFMWYVWFMVMILRVFLGMGKGVVNAVRWLLWL